MARRRRRQRSRLRRDDDRQPRVRLRAGAPRRVHRGRRRRHPVHHPPTSASTGTALEDPRRRRAGSRPHAVVERDGERIGIIGAHDARHLVDLLAGATYRIERDLAPVVNGQVAALEAPRRGQDHRLRPPPGHRRRQGAGSRFVRGVDVWIAGGGDDLLAGCRTTRSSPARSAVGAYPHAGPPTPKGKAVLIISTAGEYKYVGGVTVDFDKAGEVTGYVDAQTGPCASRPAADPDYAEEGRLRQGARSGPGGEGVLGRPREPAERHDRGGAATHGSVTNARSASARRATEALCRLVPVEGAAARADRRRRHATDRPHQPRRHPRDIAAGRSTWPRRSRAAFFNQIVVVEDVRCASLEELLSARTPGCPRSRAAFATSRACGLWSTAPAPRRWSNAGRPCRSPCRASACATWAVQRTPQKTADDTQLSRAARCAGLRHGGPRDDRLHGERTATPPVHARRGSRSRPSGRSTTRRSRTTSSRPSPRAASAGR